MRGILIKSYLIPKVADGTKTVTRHAEAGLRDINQNPDEWVLIGEAEYKPNCWLFQNNDTGELVEVKPRYQVGETVYIPEAWRLVSFSDDFSQALVYYKEGQRWGDITENLEFYYYNRFVEGIYHDWQSPLFMPAWAARYHIKILSNVPVRLYLPLPDDELKKEGGEKALEMLEKINGLWAFRYEFIEV